MGWIEMNASRVTSPVAPDEINSRDLEDLSTPQLISFLQSSFRKTDFKNVEEILRCRERNFSEELNLKEVERIELEVRYESLSKESEALTNRCLELEEKARKEEEGFRVEMVELKRKLREAEEKRDLSESKFGELEFEKFAVDDELEKYKRMYGKLNEQIARMAEDYKIAREREKRAEERVEGLSEELQKKEHEVREKFIELKVENRDLECAKRRAENEIDAIKRKYGELEARALRMVEENLSLKVREIEKDKKVKEEDKAVKQLCETSKSQICEDSMNRGKTQLFPKLEVVSDRTEVSPMQDSAKFGFGGVIEISDSEDETDNKVHASMKHTASETMNIKNEATTQNGSESLHLDKRNVDTSEDDGCSCVGSHLLTTKRKRASRVVIDDGEGEDDDDDDMIPIGKLKMKRLGEIIKGISKLNGSPVNCSSDCNYINEPLTPSRQRLVILRQCEEAKGGGKGISPKAVIAQNQSHTNANSAFTRNKATAYRKLGYLATEGSKEDGVHGGKEVVDIGLESEGECLGGFVMHGSDGLEGEYNYNDASEDEAVSDSALVRRERNTKKWEYEADMLSALSKGPELCMEAVCAIYRQQTSQEKSVKVAILANNRGFSHFDAYKGSMMAEFLMDGHPQGPLKKSVQELEKHDPKGLDYCCKLATHYSKQLFKIYQNKEDPFFLPS